MFSFYLRYVKIRRLSNIEASPLSISTLVLGITDSLYLYDVRYFLHEKYVKF